jgi:hypothetical protein
MHAVCGLHFGRARVVTIRAYDAAEQLGEPMRRAIAGFGAGAVLSTGFPARADEHVVSLSAADAVLRETAAGRQANVDAVRAFLASPAVALAASRVGIDAREVSAPVVGLSDDELRELAQRTAVLQTDPQASGTKTWLIIGIVIAGLFVLSLIAFASMDDALL